MSSYTLSEEIVGVPLFVPTDYDYFSIETAGLPNGDDCLKVLGATNRNGKAFQPAQVVSPNLFKTRTAAGWAMVFWLKVPTSIAGSGLTNGNYGRMADTFMSVSSPTLIGTGPNGDGSAGDYSRAPGNPYGLDGREYIWAVAAGSSGSTRNRLAYIAPRNESGVAAGNSAYALADNVAFDNAWHMWTLNVGAGAVEWYKDNQSTPPGGGTMDPVDTANMSIPTNLFFCIGGGYAAVQTGPAVDWFIGKVSFHSHVLNATERGLLYNAMTA